MNHPLQCQCGTLKGHIVEGKYFNHGICYCKDCQAFAHFLGRADEVLDESGGTEIIQALPAHVVFTEGKQSLACLRLKEKGLLRWYATCCNTPIGNTLPDYKVSFIGLVHSCLRGSAQEFDNAFGPVNMWVNTQGATGDVKPSARGLLPGVARFIATVTRARFNGNYKMTPFFDAERGMPVVTPKVLTGEEHEAVMAGVNGGR